MLSLRGTFVPVNFNVSLMYNVCIYMYVWSSPNAPDIFSSLILVLQSLLKSLLITDVNVTGITLLNVLKI